MELCFLAHKTILQLHCKIVWHESHSFSLGVWFHSKFHFVCYILVLGIWFFRIYFCYFTDLSMCFWCNFIVTLWHVSISIKPFFWEFLLESFYFLCSAMCCWTQSWFMDLDFASAIWNWFDYLYIFFVFDPLSIKQAFYVIGIYLNIFEEGPALPHVS